MAGTKNYDPLEGQQSFDLFPDENPETEEEQAEVEAEEVVEQAHEAVDATPLWSEYVNLLTSWGPYVGRQDLLDNANDPERKHRVWHVVDSHFDGSLSKLEDRVDELYRAFVRVYLKYQKKCQEFGVEAVSIKWMRDHLWDGDDIDSYRSRCKTRAKLPGKYPPMSLGTLPPRKQRKTLGRAN